MLRGEGGTTPVCFRGAATTVDRLGQKLEVPMSAGCCQCTKCSTPRGLSGHIHNHSRSDLPSYIPLYTYIRSAHTSTHRMTIINTHRGPDALITHSDQRNNRTHAQQVRFRMQCTPLQPLGAAQNQIVDAAQVAKFEKIENPAEWQTWKALTAFPQRLLLLLLLRHVHVRGVTHHV